MQDSISTPNPPLSLAHLPTDLAIIEAALKRLCGIARPLSTGDLSDYGTRVHYALLRARAIALESMGGVK